jgi:hypothetical protein
VDFGLAGDDALGDGEVLALRAGRPAAFKAAWDAVLRAFGFSPALSFFLIIVT